MNKLDFKKGERTRFVIYDYDDKGVEYQKQIEGVVYQTTNEFVVIDNGKYKECFQYKQMTRNTANNKDKDIYCNSIEEDNKNVVMDCISLIKSGEEGYVFSEQQLEEVLDILANESKGNEETQKYSVNKDDFIYVLKKI